MNMFKISNNIFNLGLNAQEISVYTYLCSLPSDTPMIDGDIIKVKQATIAKNCGIKAVQTVSKVITRLKEKGLAEPYTRIIKDNHQKGTYLYKVKKLSVKNSFFSVDRHIFGKLTPNQMMIYLFISKAYSIKLGYCWNSYNDISKQTGMKRETVIKAINELVKEHFIIRSRHKSRDNKKVFVDNHYSIVPFVHLKIKRKAKKLRLSSTQKNNRIKSINSQLYVNNLSTKLLNCQDSFCFSFSIRGSP